MTKQRVGFYIGTFHNNESKYVDEIKVTGKPEIFEQAESLDRMDYPCYRLNDNFWYALEDFTNPIFLDASEIIESSDTLIKDNWYWAVAIEIWEPIYTVSVNNKFRFKRLGRKGLFPTANLRKIGLMIDLSVSQERFNDRCSFDKNRPDIVIIDDVIKEEEINE